MEYFFNKLSLKTLNDWQTVNRTMFNKIGGSTLIKQYENNFVLLLRTVYPNYPWNPLLLKIRKKKEKRPSGLQLTTLESQKQFMQTIYEKLELKSISDWAKVSRWEFKLHGGAEILKLYKDDMKLLLPALYPDELWIFKPVEFFKSKENKKRFVEYVVKKLKLKTLEKFLKVSKTKIIELGGMSLLAQYKSDRMKLLCELYPTHKWIFQASKKKEILCSREEQAAFMDTLFTAFSFHSLDQLVGVTIQQLRANAGTKLLQLYRYNYQLILLTIYPNYPWKFQRITPELLLSSLDHQRTFIQQIALNCKVKRVEDWVFVSPMRFINKGGELLLTRCYDNDMQLMLRSVYPSIPWNFNQQDIQMERERRIMAQIYKKNKFESMEDWLTATNSSFTTSPSGRRLLETYNYSIKDLLSAVYPHHPWDFEKLKINPNFYFRSMTNRRNFMENLFKKLKLKRLDDWLRVTRKQINSNGGQSLLRFYYQNDLKKLLADIYPNHQWSFDLIHTRGVFKKFENQQRFMQQLEQQYNFSSPDDWLANRQLFLDHGGKVLLSYYYNGDWRLLLKTLYPHHQWYFDSSIKGVERDCRLMHRLFRKFKLSSLDDWLGVSKSQMVAYGGRGLLLKYQYDMKLLLSTIYPGHHFEFERLRYKPSMHYTKSFAYNYSKLLRLKDKFAIREKKDWYRISILRADFNVLAALRVVYPTERWSLSEFHYRAKKMVQRLLFGCLSSLFSSHSLFENYRHPLLLSHKDFFFEVDIFIPSLNLGFEYQGQQHYDDLPSGFGPFDLYRSNDQTKEKLAQGKEITLIAVPYWWDRSSHSLLSSLSSFYRNAHSSHFSSPSSPSSV